MTRGIESAFLLTNITKYQTTSSTEMTEEQRRIKAAELEKAEQERQEKWEARADVVYHFFAYRYFDRSSTCLDLLNFTDADIDIFNLTANKARGLDNWHVCATYLKKLKSPTPATNTQRRKLLHHVRSFNETQPSHFRFYLCNLTPDDIEYIQGLGKADKGAGNGEVTKEMKFVWATSCVEDEVPVDVHNDKLTGTDAVDHVEVSSTQMQDRSRQSSPESDSFYHLISILHRSIYWISR